MNDAELLELAQAATPAEPQIRGRWAKLLPAFETLRSKGFSCAQAVEWLKDQGKVPSGEELRAQNSLIALSARKRRS